MLAAIRQWVLKTMMKDQTGVMRTLPKKDLVDFNVAMTAERLMQNGIDPNALKNANQVENAINQIEAPRNVQQGIKSTPEAKVFDMEGKEIPKGSKIMGGKQAETEAEIAARMSKENKESAARIRNRSASEDRAIEDFVDDAGGVNPDDPRGIDDFIPDPEDMAQGGRVGLMAGSVPKIFTLLKNPKKVKQAIDNIFPTGDVKYDATMAAESLVELNPKIFGNKLYDDLDSITRLDIYDAVISPMMSAQAKALRMKKATKPEKTLQSMKEGKGINMSDPEIAKEFEQFMKQTDPEGVKKLEQTFELDNFDPKGRKKNATGGRIGFKDGMTRRSFLKILGGLAAIPIVGKFLKPIKTAKGIKSVPIIKTAPVEGKPEWFDALVNKVILEGDDVTKKFATKEREIVHTTKIDDQVGGPEVRVTQDLDDGVVRVEYESVENMYGDPVSMQYKKSLPDEDMPKGGAPEFTTAESGPVGRAFGPDDYEIEIDELGGTSISDLTSDVSKLKEYATGKKPTLKEFIQSKKRKDKAKAVSEGGENEMQEVIDRQGEFIQFDDINPDPPDFASGGIARMLGE